jgi:hypothetical protein
MLQVSEREPRTAQRAYGSGSAENAFGELRAV